jgi:hypothetical protein
MEWMDKTLTGEAVGKNAKKAKTGSPAKSTATRQSPRRKDKQETEVHSIPSDSEEPTEFGVVWERFVIKETENRDV